MNTRNLPLNGIVCGLALLAANGTLAGLMHPDIPLQTYRDFAENRGRFAADATNVPVYYKDGTPSGTIPRMMSFESVVDEGFAALTGNPQFLATVAHNGGYQTASFTKRFGGQDNYRVVKKNNGWGEKTDYTYDIQVARLDKIVTEAEPVPFVEDEELLLNIKGKPVLRAGGGTQKVAVDKDNSNDVAGAYSFLTGGTVIFTNVLSTPPSNNPEHPASKYRAFQFQYSLQLEKNPDLPLPICILGGDSGSGSWIYNDKNKRWEYIGPGQSGGGGGFSQMRSSNIWSIDVIRSYFDPEITSSSSTPILWKPTNTEGQGKLVQGASSWAYHGLAQGKAFPDATMDELEKTRNLVFSGTPSELRLEAPVDMGAGSLTFKTNMKLTASQPSHTLYSAGMDIRKGTTVTSTLTAKNGQEWRKVGKGTLIIEGNGDNPASLNLGDGQTILNRENGKAASSVMLVSGRPALRLQGDNQLAGPVHFGAKGGLLDLYGHSLTWNTLPHLDEGARITNLKPGTTSTFTYTGTGSFFGVLTDGGDAAKGLLKIVYAPEGKDDQATWTWSGKITNKGGIEIRSGHISITGRPTPHAANFVDPSDWITSVVQTGKAPIILHPGTTLTIGAHTAVQANFIVMKGATLTVDKDAAWQGIASVEQGGAINLSPEAKGKNVVKNKS